jgi:hypothetical protein
MFDQHEAFLGPSPTLSYHFSILVVVFSSSIFKKIKSQINQI